jgi:hypothetical protein
VLSVCPSRARCNDTRPRSATAIPPAARKKSWTDYVAGVAWALQQAGCSLRGADLLIANDVPIGAGLSSSAALEVSVAYALLGAANATLPPLSIALACQRAENEFVGARCGMAVRAADPAATSGRGVRRAHARRRIEPGSVAADSGRNLRPPVRGAVSLLDGLASAPEPQPTRLRMDPARTFPAAAAALGDRAQVSGRLRNARHAQRDLAPEAAAARLRDLVRHADSG